MNGTMPAAVAALSQVPAVQAVTAQFRLAGRHLYAVGGCIRDALSAGDTPVVSPDIDFTTDAGPDTIAAILDPLGAIWDAGARFGTIGVAVPDGSGGFDKVEVTTHRAETYETTSRKPSVVLVSDIDEDLARRDLTINAIALRLTPGPITLIDPFGGARDLHSQVLRTPTDPRRTLDEDPLRILRVIRFAARHGFTIDPGLRAACREFADRLDIVAAERRTDELRKILALGGQRCLTAFELADSFGVSGHLLGGVAVTGQLRDAFARLDDSRLVLAAVVTDSLLDGGDGDARLRAAKLANDETVPAVTVGRLVHSGALRDATPSAVRTLIRRFGVATVRDAVAVSDAFGRPCGEFTAMLVEVLGCHPDLAAMPLPVNGDDALVAGLRGRAIGDALRAVEAAFCADPGLTRDQALHLLR